MLIVHKFGGTSLGDAQRFKSVAEILIQHKHSGDGKNGTVAVVSAMSGVTDLLTTGALAAANQDDRQYRKIKADLLKRHLDLLESVLEDNGERLIAGGFIEDSLHELELLYRSLALLGELTSRGKDRITSFGEQLSANILAALLREGGVRAEALSATEIIRTDQNFGAAQPLLPPTQQRVDKTVKPLIVSGAIPVITGYIASSETGVATTLGRGGSDFSAAILGACLEADEVWIWSDVDGILTADPNIVPLARTLEKLSYAEAAELAFYGAEVLHPKTIQPLVERSIPLRLLNSFNPSHPGTKIIPDPEPDRTRLPAIISTSNLTMIRLGINGNNNNQRWSLDHSSRVLSTLCDIGIDIPMFSQSFSEHTLNLIVRQHDQDHCLSSLKNRLEGNTQINIKEKVAIISVVGVPDWNDQGIIGHTFDALGKLGTRIIAIAQAASEHSISVCIPEEDTIKAVRLLHSELGLEK